MGLLHILASIGVFAIGLFLFAIWLMIWDYIKSKISDYKYAYKRKHRFDKPPLAKCYCVDCFEYNPKTGYCTTFSRCMGDNQFCSLAYCRKTDPDKLEKED